MKQHKAKPVNVLFLDDDAVRRLAFRRLCPSAVICETAQEAVSEIGRRDWWDLIFLDHDLNGKVMQSSEEPDTGMSVVRWMDTMRPAVGRVVVHSFNAPAAQLMCDQLEALGYMVEYRPFCLDECSRLLAALEP